MASWQDLAKLRKRGQRPMGLLYLTDDGLARRAIERNYGLWALPLPSPEQSYLLSGLWVLMVGRRTPEAQEIAPVIAAAGPKRFTIGWLGERWDHVI